MNSGKFEASNAHLGAVVILIVTTAILVALGGWQLERRTWKLALIAEVDRRVNAPPQPAPEPPQREGESGPLAPYSRVLIHGVYRAIQPILVQAVTEKGSGYWVLAPLTSKRGFTVLVNRGFVPLESLDQLEAAPTTEVTITGLLRASEPEGGFLRRNMPAANRWYSRDVEAIARAHALSGVAPYFVDADATPGSHGWPAGGMTVVHFRNAHLGYALTWFSLAVMLTGWGVWSARRPRSTASAE